LGATTGGLAAGGVGEADGVTGDAEGEADADGGGGALPLGLPDVRDDAPALSSASA
jgi:hypothetical protein